MTRIEVNPEDEYTRIASADFDTRAADRLMSVASTHVLVALGCKGCASRVCIDVDASNGNANEVFTQVSQALNGLGVPAHVVSHRASKTVSADCPTDGGCTDNVGLGLDFVCEEARLRELGITLHLIHRTK